MTAFETVTAQLIAVTGFEGRNGMWRCPAHDDRSPSLAVSNGDGKVRVHCHAKCKTEDVVAALGLQMRDLFDQPLAQNRISRSYNYTDEHGKLLFKVHRFWPKDFRQQAADGTWSLKNVRRVPYRLPEVIEAARKHDRVYVVEGEKDADAIVSCLGVATCNPGGAGKWRDEYNHYLLGSDVVIVADKDDAGHDHARKVRQSLTAAGVTVEAVVEAKTGKDAADHLAAGHHLDEFPPVDLDEPEIKPASIFVDWPAFWTRTTDDSQWLYEPILAKGRGHAIFAGHKVGKSLILLFISLTLARGSPPARVVYLDYEMGADDLEERLTDMGVDHTTDLERLCYALIPPLPPLDTGAGADALLAIVDDQQAAHPDDHLLVVVDTTARAVAGEENSADTIRAFYRHTGSGLKRRGVTWVRLDHAGKDATKGQRGSSAKGDDVDVVWQVTPADRGGLVFTRRAARVSWVPETVNLSRRDDPDLAFELVPRLYSAGVAEKAELLDRLGAPTDIGVREARKLLKDHNQMGGHNALLSAAVGYRKQHPNLARLLPGNAG